MWKRERHRRRIRRDRRRICKSKKGRGGTKEKRRDLDPDSLEMLDPNPDLLEMLDPDPDSWIRIHKTVAQCAKKKGSRETKKLLVETERS